MRKEDKSTIIEQIAATVKEYNLLPDSPMLCEAMYS